MGILKWVDAKQEICLCGLINLFSWRIIAECMFYTLTYEMIKVVHLHRYPFPTHLDILEQHSLSASLKIPAKVN